VKSITTLNKTLDLYKFNERVELLKKPSSRLYLEVFMSVLEYLIPEFGQQSYYDMQNQGKVVSNLEKCIFCSLWKIWSQFMRKFVCRKPWIILLCRTSRPKFLFERHDLFGHLDDFKDYPW